MITDSTRYLEWDGTHIGRDSFLNPWDGSVTSKDSGSCKVSFKPAGTSSLNMCVTVEEFHIEDCNATINYYHYDDSERKAVLTLFFFLKFETYSYVQNYCMVYSYSPKIHVALTSTPHF